MPSSNSAARGGIDLGGTKIEAMIVNAQNTVLGSARRPTPTEGGPEDVAEQMIEASARRSGRRRRDRRRCAASAWARPAWSTRRPGRCRPPATCPTGRAASGSATRCPSGLGTPVFVGNDVQVATDAEFKLGAGKPYKSLLGVFWGTGVGGGLVLNGKPWIGRGGAGEIGHMVVRIGGATLPVRPARVHGGLRRPRRDGSARAQARRRGHEDRPVQADEGARAHAR